MGIQIHLQAFEKWSVKATEIKEKSNCKITVSALLEDEANESDRINGLDIADFIIAELKSNKTSPEIQSFFSHTLQSMIDKNKALLILLSNGQNIMSYFMPKLFNTNDKRSLRF